MDINRPIPAEVYEKFLGFPEYQEGQKDVERFLVHCTTLLDNLKEVHLPEQRVLRVLSIGTGYGRADLPFIKAYIDRCEKLIADHSLSFQVDCVDPSPDFQEMLENTLKNDLHHYKIFFENPQFSQAIEKNTFQASGKSASGKSNVFINAYTQSLTKYLSELSNIDDDNQSTFHCIVAILSLQCIKHLKIIFPRLLEKLRYSGIIVIGETCSEGAWLSKPPPIWVSKTKSNSRWYRLWTDWHNALYEKGINRRIRLFMPDNFQLLVDSLESSGFVNVIPSKKSEFTWPKTVTSECFSKVTELIKTGGWKNCVSSLHLYNQDLGKDSPEDSGKKACVVNILESGEWQNQTDTDYENGIRLYVYKNGNENLLNYKNYEQMLQKVVLKNSERTILEQGICRHIRVEMTKGKSRENRLIQLVQSLIQHVEIDNGCFVIGLRVSSRHASRCAIGGALTPCSKVSIDKGKASKFYEKLNLSESNPKTYQRVWLWVYTLYLALAKRPSAVADRLYRIFELNSAFDCIVDMYAENETLDVSRRGISIKLKRDRMKAVRETVWNSLEKLTDKKREVAKWEKESKVVRALEHFWGKNSPLVQVLRRGSRGNMDSSIQGKTNEEHLYALPEVFDPDPDQPIEFSNAQIEDLFDKAAFQNIKHNIDDTFKNWAEDNSEPGIHAILERMFVSPTEKTEPIPLCTDIFYQFYLFSLFLHEKDLNYISHIPAMEFNSVGVWGGFQIFMDKEEYSFFKATGHSDLSDIFYKFISPFDIILLRDTVGPKVEEATHGLGLSDMTSALSHEVEDAASFLFNRIIFPADSLETSTALPDKSQWLVCPVPSIFDACLNNIFIHTGGRGCMAKLFQKAQGKKIALKESLNILINEAKEIAAIRSLDNVLWEPYVVAKRYSDFKTAKKKFQLQLEGGDNLIFIVNEDTLSLQIFVRCFLAAGANCLQHCRDGASRVKIDHNHYKDCMQVVFSNYGGEYKHKRYGTEDTLRALLKRLGPKFAEKLFMGNVNSNVVTRFLVPCDLWIERRLSSYGTEMDSC